MRQALGLTQEQFGGVFGITRHTVMNYESDESIPENMQKFFDLFVAQLDPETQQKYKTALRQPLSA